MDVSLSELQELVMDREVWGAVIHGVAKIRTRLSDWTELNLILCDLYYSKKHYLYYTELWIKDLTFTKEMYNLYLSSLFAKQIFLKR